MRNVLITGANGFVGRALCESLAQNGNRIRPVIRSEYGIIGDITPFVVNQIDLNTDWAAALTDVEVIVHLASRVHQRQEGSNDSIQAYRRVNTEGTLNLARQAVAAGVKRFVFVSTIKVNGEGGDSVYSEDDTPCPMDSYAISKWEAEKGLVSISETTGMEVVIIRPPLVYGPEVKANFLSMMQWLYRGIPLPLGAIHNKRSLLALGNLVDLVTRCMTHPAAANQLFLASDGDDLSTSELLVRTASAIGVEARLIGIPERWVEIVAARMGKRDLSRRLCGSLQVSISKAQTVLGWSPPIPVDEGLRITAKHFLANLPKNQL